MGISKPVPTSSLRMSSSDSSAPVVASVLAAAFLFSNIIAVAPAFADDPIDSSSQVIAARSGGRMGGRSSMGSRGRSSMGASRGSYNSYSRTTVVRPMVTSPVIVAPPMYSPFSPFSPFGFGFGLGGGIGDSYRDYRQDGEIARERSELQEAKIRQAELEQRIAQLEGAPKALPQQQPAQ
ncbi:expressed unknown protein [Seminavis robusta]|uniref:Uncharacterized protein n=1 Tax=Seminavis robusta TaxID=568900 RepID=A0A9N8HD56_9STRA|nr:expressed unknown protein [Seminavis robusta]|eukprot:Sro246_g097810.1 n/a (180) ;mRNA; f:62556-63197